MRFVFRVGRVKLLQIEGSISSTFHEGIEDPRSKHYCDQDYPAGQVIRNNNKNPNQCPYPSSSA